MPAKTIDRTMPAKTIDRTPSADSYPLLIKNLLRNPVRQFPKQEIVYGDFRRQTYRELGERIGRLASGLAGLGIKPGDTVAVMDWDSHRYLECFFAVPMLGAVLHTVNIRLSPEQILYTINHAEDDVILLNAEFLPILETIRDRIEPVKKLVLLNDADQAPTTVLDIATDYEALLATGDPDYRFPDFSEDTRATTFYTRATTFYTTGTTGLPKGVYFSHRQLVLHTFGALATFTGTDQGRFGRDDVYMPITPMFHVHAWGVPYVATALGVKQIYPGRYVPDHLLTLIEREKVTFSHCVPTILQMLLDNPKVNETDLSRWKVIIGGAALPRALAKQARDRGIDIFTGYGMSETCPLLTLAHLKPHMLDWDEERQLEIRCKTGLPMPNSLQDGSADAVGRTARGGRGDERFAARWQNAGRSGGPRTMADPGLPEGSQKLRNAVARGLSAYRRHRHHRRGGLPQNHRPAEGRDQDRR